MERVCFQSEAVEMTILSKSIRILGKDYELIHDNTGLSDQNLLGRSKCAQQKIFYADDQGAAQLRDTLLHEILHVVDWTVKAELKENQVAAIASGLYAVFKDNPEFVEWLMKDMK